MKTATLSFTIQGKAKAVNQKAEAFMNEMSKFVGKEIDRTTLIGITRKDNPRKPVKL